MNVKDLNFKELKIFKTRIKQILLKLRKKIVNKILPKNIYI